MGTQSAVEMPMHCCGKLVIRASMSCNRATCSVADWQADYDLDELEEIDDITDDDIYDMEDLED